MPGPYMMVAQSDDHLSCSKYQSLHHLRIAFLANSHVWYRERALLEQNYTHIYTIIWVETAWYWEFCGGNPTIELQRCDLHCVPRMNYCMRVLAKNIKILFVLFSTDTSALARWKVYMLSTQFSKNITASQAPFHLSKPSQEWFNTARQTLLAEQCWSLRI